VFIQSLILITVISIISMILLLLYHARGRTGLSVGWPIIGILLWDYGLSLPYILNPSSFAKVFPHWAVLLLLGGSFGFGCSLLLVFALYPTPTWRKGLGAALIALLGLFTILARTSIPTISRFHPLSLLHGQQDWAPPVSTWLLVCGILALGYLAFWAFRARGQRRVQVRYTLAGVGLICLGVALQFFVHVPRTQIPSPLAPLLASCCGIALLTYAHASRYPLLNGRLLLRPFLAFTVTLVIVGLFWQAIGQPVRLYLHDVLRYPYDSVNFLVNILQAATFLLLYPLAAFIVQRFLLRFPYDERKTLLQTSAALLSVYDIDEVVERLSGIINRTIHPIDCALYLPNTEGQLTHRGRAAEDGPLPASLAPSHPVWQELIQCRDVLLSEELRRYDGRRAVIGEAMRDDGAAVAVPLVSEDGIRGCLLCMEKQSGDGYTRQDLQVLTALCQHTSLALENVEHYMRLSNMNADLKERVAERTRELTEANSQLQQANVAKDFFLALVSHELLNPLTGIMGWADVGLRTENPEVRAQVIATIHKNGLRLKRLVYDLLDTARMIHGKLTVEPEPTDLWYLVMAELKNAEQELQTKRLDVVCQAPDGSLPVMADPGRMQQVIDNLLTNAIKFTPAGGTITVTGQRDGEMCTLSIRDTGKGIPAERLTRIFERFHQLPGDHKAGGLGLGLALVHGIIELHDGAITANSPGPGQGSTFTVVLPALTEAAKPEEASAASVAPQNME